MACLALGHVVLGPYSKTCKSGPVLVVHRVVVVVVGGGIRACLGHRTDLVVVALESFLVDVHRPYHAVVDASAVVVVVAVGASRDASDDGSNL